MRVYVFVVFFTRGDHIDSLGLERRERAHSKGNKSCSAPFEVIKKLEIN